MLGAVQPAGTTTVSEPFCMPPAAAVYVNVIVLPVWLAETFDIEVVNVPEPSAASGGMRATRCATQFVALPRVAVLAPVAPAPACAPSAPVVRILLAFELPEMTVYS